MTPTQDILLYIKKNVFPLHCPPLKVYRYALTKMKHIQATNGIESKNQNKNSSHTNMKRKKKVPYTFGRLKFDITVSSDIALRYY